MGKGVIVVLASIVEPLPPSDTVKPGEPDLRGFEWRYLWNLCRGDTLHTFSGHSDAVQSVAFSADGQTLATAGDDALKLWNANSRRLMVTLEETNVRLPQSFSPDNKLLATAKLGGPVTVWTVATRQPVWVLESEAFSQFPKEGGTLSTISTNHNLRFWDVATRTLQRAVPLPGIAGASRRVPINLGSGVVGYAQFIFAPGGNRLAAVDANAMITLQDTTTGDAFRTRVRSKRLSPKPVSGGT